MRESISNSYIFTIVITIIGLCTIIVISSLSYSKTFKIKNRIIEIIEKHETYNATAEAEINDLLKTSGYNMITGGTATCPRGRGEEVFGIPGTETGLTAINTLSAYKYCIYRYKTAKGSYYSVVTYMAIELPVIGNFFRLEFPVYGDTRIFADF